MAKRGVVTFAVLAAFHAAAQALPEADVEGWAPGQDGRGIEIFSRDGVPQRPEDLSRLNIVGRHPWDPSLQIVELPGSRWVESKRLKLKPCEIAKSEFAPPSRTGPTGAKVYGSGPRCAR